MRQYEDFKKYSISCANNFPYIENTFESLDLYGLISKILKYLTVVTNNIEVLKEDIDEFRQIIDNIDVNFEQLNRDIYLLNQKIDNKITETKSELYNYIDNIDTTLNNKLDNEVARLEEEINDMAITDIDILNPATGQVENIQKVINDLYELNRIYAISCAEFDNLEITASVYDNKQITAYDFDNYSKSILEN